MRLRLSLPISLLLLLGVLAVAHRLSAPEAQAEGQKPIKHTDDHVDGGVGAPATLNELWGMSPLVVDAVVVKARPFDKKLDKFGQSTHEMVRTAYELKITEVFKGGVSEGRIVEVMQIGGDRDRGAYIESVHDPTFKRMRLSERYILFLKPSINDKGIYRVVTDTADGVFLLAEDGTVEARGRSQLAQDLERHARETLLNLLRDLRDLRQ